MESCLGNGLRKNEFIDKIGCCRELLTLMRNRNRRGFTLIELLVVIVIIGILSAMTVTGFGWWAETQREKTAESQIEALQLALEQYKSQTGGFPNTEYLENSNDEEARGILLFQALSGLVDRKGKKINADKRGKSFLPNRDSFIYGSREEGGIQQVTLSLDQLQGVQVPDVFLLDPWDSPYVYEFPRRDGHKGFLLFSKGSDGKASVFDSELVKTPEKEDMDMDNIPPSEPGKW